MSPIRRRFAIFLSAIVLSTLAPDLEPMVMRDIMDENGSGRLAFGTTRIPPWNFAFAQTPNTISLENVTFLIGDSTFKAKRVDLSGATSTKAEFEALLKKPLEKLDPESLRKLTPAVGSIRLEGVEFDPRDPKAQGQRFTLRSLEIKSDKPSNSLPTELKFDLQNLAMVLPPDSQDTEERFLLGLGYKTIDISSRAAANWNEASRELQINELFIDGHEMGRIVLRGLLGNVAQEVFSAAQDKALAALSSAKAKKLELSVENKSFLDRFLAHKAEQQKKTPEAVRKEYEHYSSLIIAGLLGNAPQAKALGDTIGRFFATGTRLSMQANAKDPSGIGLSEVSNIKPDDILNKVEIVAKAEERL